jgi:hypothetical protein
MENETQKQSYESPQTEVIFIALEQCIANGSATLNELEYNQLLDELSA